MAETTVRALANLVGKPVEKLLEQLSEAGMAFDGPDQVVSSKDKVKLLGFLRRNHGKMEKVADDSSPRQITLKRRKVQELTVASGKQKNVVNVEVRQKRTYVKRSEVEVSDDPEREEAQRLLDESRQRQEAEESARRELEEKRAAEEAERQAEEAKAKAEREAEARAREEERAEQARSREEDKQESPARKAVPKAVEPPVEPREARGTDKPRHKDSHGKGRGHDRDRGPGRGRSLKGELHLSDAERARRSRGKRSRRPEPSRGASSGGPHGFTKPTAAVVRDVAIGETIIVSELAQKMAVKGADVVKALFKMGVMATINQTIDHDTAALVVDELGHNAVRADDTDKAEQQLAASSEMPEGNAITRPPVVTIMGHVDHGKTSLLDCIRSSRVATGEAGGITQHIGAYHVETDKGVVSFLDTPGHAAFTAMRARGAKLTDIVVLVVAADDGVMPQTKEAVEHARAAGVPLIVAVNKMDKSDANPDNVKQGLSGLEVVPEEWGGETPFVPVSAKAGTGIDDLLDAILLQAEVMELKAVPEARASGMVIESSLDKGRGPVATVLVQQGTLKKGDFMVCGVEYGRARALFDENGKQADSAGPSIPVQVLGLSGVPEAGDEFVVVADERLAREVAQQRQDKRRESRLVQKPSRMEDIMALMGQGAEQQVLNVLIKADVQGSVEALRESLVGLSNDMIRINVVAAGVGGITESDATLASASKAVVIGFNVRADASARKLIERDGVDLRYFSIIYDVIDQVKQVASGMLGVEIREEIIGVAEVREVFRSSKFGAVAGSMVVEGVVRSNKPIRVLRDNVVIFEGELESLRRFKDNVDEVRMGTECGIGVKQYNDVKPGDQIECFERIEVQRSL
ncbi:MAG: translation initiation factor IF-2 [Xanthomonadales bacterium]|nr:translation initiation factor IF-2 [Xanthomonadales bacterium]